jgi:prepilin-type N-terminal cleavage/methylation domain-containing protein
LSAREAGFTLVELLVVMTILGVVIGGLTTAFTSATKAQLNMTRRFEAQQEGRLALDKIRREAHCASGATVVGTSLVTLTFPTTGTTPCPAGAGIANVTWCARAGVNGYELYRIPSSTATCTGGVRVANYLVSTNVFQLLPTGAGELAKLRVTLPVDLTPADTSERYSLVDDIAFRNTTRA